MLTILKTTKDNIEIFLRTRNYNKEQSNEKPGTEKYNDGNREVSGSVEE